MSQPDQVSRSGTGSAKRGGAASGTEQSDLPTVSATEGAATADPSATVRTPTTPQRPGTSAAGGSGGGQGGGPQTPQSSAATIRQPVQPRPTPPSPPASSGPPTANQLFVPSKKRTPPADGRPEPGPAGGSGPAGDARPPAPRPDSRPDVRPDSRPDPRPAARPGTPGAASTATAAGPTAAVPTSSGAGAPTASAPTAPAPTSPRSPSTSPSRDGRPGPGGGAPMPGPADATIRSAAPPRPASAQPAPPRSVIPPAPVVPTSGRPPVAPGSPTLLGGPSAGYGTGTPGRPAPNPVAAATAVAPELSPIPPAPGTQRPQDVGRGPASSSPAAGETPGGPRKVRLTVARIDPFSAMKLSFLLSVAFAIATVVASIVVWQVLDAMGVWDSLNTQVRDLAGKNSKFDLNDYVGLGRVVSISTLVSVVNVIVTMALATLGAVLYNIAASLVGGINLTLSDD